MPRVILYMPDELLAQINAEALLLDRTRSWVIRQRCSMNPTGTYRESLNIAGDPATMKDIREAE